MRFTPSSFSLAALAAAVCAPALSAQWVTFQDQTSTRLVAAAGLVASDTQEKDYTFADFDQDGDIDLVIMRKQPQTTPGAYPNVLLMNENGVLTDRTAALASASLVAGSQGMLDATNDRDSVAVDVDGDGWLDLVTCTTLSQTQPQYIRVPRVYINRGDDVAGNWLGFIYDDVLRINDMQPGASWNGEHRFCSVAAGDIDNDNDMDLYFGDYEQGGGRSIDVNDRLLINNGLGYFTDETTARMTFQMVESSFGMHVEMVDMNQDGKLDILKDDALNAPQGISISYNNGPSVGIFGTYASPYLNAPYHFNIGDLNNDGRPDMIVSDDGQDRYILHAGNVGGLATFSSTIAFTYSPGGSGHGDDGFAGNNYIVDLNNDGWNDVVIADVDVDIGGCSRRCHIYRNLGNAPNVTLQEQIVSGQVVGGITPAALTGTFDVAVFDINGDGWKDMVIGRCTGTQIWINQPPTGMTMTYPGGLPTLIPPGTVRTLDVNATGLGGITPVAGTGVLHYSVNGAPFQSSPMADIGPGQYRATLPVLPNCADDLRYYVRVNGNNSVTYSDPPTAPAGFYDAVAAVGTVTIYENNFEGAVTGWTVQNTSLTAGAWEVAIPNGTITGGGAIAAPFDDAEAGAAAKCYVTLNGPAGGAANSYDVDGGPTDLISPALNFAGTDGFISYRRWYFCSNSNDNMTVSVSPDGVNWTTVEVVVGPTDNQWLSHQFRVGDFITPSANVRVRFRIADVGNNSTTEGGIDVFKAEVFTCDVCQPTISLSTVGSATMTMCGGDLSPGTSTTLSIVNMPPGTNGFLLFDLFLVPTPWQGGALISPAPNIFGPVFASGAGSFVVPLPIGGLLPPGWSVYTQTVYFDAAQPFGVGQTNAVQVQW